MLDLCSQQSEFHFSHQLASRQFMILHFSRQTRDKLSSIFPALAGDHKVASQGFIRTSSIQYGLISKTRSGIGSVPQVTSLTDVLRKELDRFQAAL